MKADTIAEKKVQDAMYPLATEFSTPVNILWENVLLVPVYGIIDTMRAQQITNAILEKISETRAKTIILDILAIGTMDSAIANHIVNMTEATRLMGCTCIISGISPAIAEILVRLGIDLKDIITTSTLQDALSLSFDMLGLEVRKKK